MISTSQSILQCAEDGRRDLPLTTIEIKKVGQIIARLKLEADGTCYGIWVDRQHRRQGHATSLWRYAQAAGFNPKHSAERTVDGQAWAASLNEPLPKLVNV